MVSTGTGDVGAAKLTGEILDIVNRVPMLVKNMTGVDISKVSLRKFIFKLANITFLKMRIFGKTLKLFRVLT